MFRSICITLLLGFSIYSVAQPLYRSIDGSGNNSLNPEWGKAGSMIERATSNGYTDSMSAPAGLNRPNPRTISNVIFDQDVSIPNPYDLSDFVWTFGQFIDHDITLVPDNHAEFLPISVPAGDPDFDPAATGTAIIPMFRSMSDPTTGTSTSNPRMQVNNITSWIDASVVYGSDSARAAWLRTFSYGKLKTSAGNLLPYNTITGEYGDPLDPSAPGMANEGAETFIFVCGDVRGNEQPGLTAMHTLFVREHNRLCDIIKANNLGMTDEEIYQRARKIVAGLIQKVTFEDWLPVMGVILDTYPGYDPQAKPNIMNVFSVAAYRLGHTMVGSKLLRMDEHWDTLQAGHISLRDAFFSPSQIKNLGLSPYFRGMLIQRQQNVDAKIVDDLRNFLFGIPGFGGLDLASINIMRGRERGLVDYNQIRMDMGLNPITDFSNITSDTSVQSKLQSLYGQISNIDPWVGMLAEDHKPGAAFGECIKEILKYQFARLRDGDWYYYENNPSMIQVELNYIRNTTLANIIENNSDVVVPRENVFKIWDPSLCSAPAVLVAQTTNYTANLSWDKISGVGSYTVRGTKTGHDSRDFVYLTTDTNSILVANLEEGTSYYWQVSANCSEGASLFSDLDTFTTMGTNCTAPMSLAEINITGNSVDLSWTSVPAAVNYVVRGSKAPFGSSDIGYFTTSDSTVHIVNLEPNTTYFWQVKALCNSTPLPKSEYSQLREFTTNDSSSSLVYAGKNSWDEADNAMINVYPNPGNSIFYLDMENFREETVKVEILDLSGKILYQSFHNSTMQAQLDLSELANGTYILHVSGKEHSRKGMIVKVGF